MHKKNDHQSKNDMSKNPPQEKKEIEKIKEKLQSLEAQLREMENNWKRALADYRNLQRRTNEDRTKAVKFANYELISELIEVYDNMRMMEKHSDDPGFKMITDQFWEKLNYHGLSQVEALNQKFDETTMEAIETINGPEGKVVEVIQNGYIFKDRLVRPAKVIVGNGEKIIK